MQTIENLVLYNPTNKRVSLNLRP